MKPKVNRELFRRVIAAIEREPRAFHMDTVGERAVPGRTVPVYVRDQKPPCGTVACIAGHALLLTGQAKFDLKGGLRPVRGRMWDEAAAEALRVPLGRAHVLFYTENWPDRFRVRFAAAKTPRARARVAVARIRHFLNTGE